ncbi:hypothetical protein [Phenylobacterium sp.]|uniref:hypothetical protein n=1 Tax=Phenylobacterium sp. TaxID=1871053 RepID=UPI0039835519
MLRRRLITLVASAALAPAGALAAGKSEKKRVGGDSYVVIKTLVGTTVRQGGRRGVMTVDCGLDIPDAALRDRAESVLPRLRAAYAQIVQTYAAGLPSGAAPNADFIARALQRQTDAVLGKPGARLLVGAIQVN